MLLANGDPVGTGIVASLAHPGGNIIGTSSMIPELAGKQVELLKEVMPPLRRIAALYMRPIRSSETRSLNTFSSPA